MADEAVEQLLLRFGIDLSDVKTGATGLKAIFDQLNAASKASTTATQLALNEAKQKLAEIKTQTESIISASKTEIAQNQAKASALKLASEELKKQAIEQLNAAKVAAQGTAEYLKQKEALSLQTQEIMKQRAEGALKLQQLQLETAEYRKQLLLQQQHTTGGGAAGAHGSSGIGGFFGRLIGGPVGQIAGGVAIGQVATQGLEHFIEKLKEVTKEAGKLTIIEDVFQRFAKGAGVDGNEMIEKMEKSTDGLIGKVTLLGIANAALRNKTGLAADQIAVMLGNVTKLAQAAGKSPEQAIRSIETGLAGGRLMAVARQAGISMAEIRAGMQQLPRGLNAMQRQIQQNIMLFDLLDKKAKAIGDIPDTFENMLKRIAVAQKDVFEGFGQGLNKSAGMQAFLAMMKELIGNFRTLEGGAQKFGEKVGDAFLVIGVAAKSLVPVIKSLGSVLGQLFAIIGDLVSIGSPFENLSSSASAARDQFSQVHPVLAKITNAIIDINMYLGIMALTLEHATKGLRVFIEGFTKDQGDTRIDPSTGRKQKRTYKGIFRGNDVYADQPFTAEDIKSSGLTKLPKESEGEFKARAERYLAAGNQVAYVKANPPEDTQSLSEGIERLKAENSALKTSVAEQMNKSDALFAKTGPGIAPPTDTGGETQQQKMKRFTAEAQERKSANALTLADTQKQLAEERELENESYADGEKTLKKHLTKLADLDKEEAIAKNERLAADFISQKTLREQQAKSQNLAPDVVKTQEKKALEDYAKAADEIEKQLDSKLAGYRRQEARDRKTVLKTEIQEELADRKAAAQATLALIKDQVQNQRQALSRSAGRGEVTPAQEHTQQMGFIAQETSAEIDAENAKHDAAIDHALSLYLLNEKADGAKAALDKETADADRQNAIAVAKIITDAGYKRLTLLDEYIQKEETFAKKQFQGPQQFLSGRLQTTQALPGGQGAVQEVQLMQQLVDLSAKEVDYWTQILSQTKYSSEKWFEIVTNIEKAADAQQKYNLELKNATSWSNAVSGFGQALSNAASIFTSKFARNLAQTINSAIQGIDKFKDQLKILKGGQPQKDPKIVALETAASQAAAALKVPVTPLSALATAAQNAAVALNNLAAKTNETAGKESGGSGSGGSGSGETDTEGNDLPTAGHPEQEGEGSGEANDGKDPAAATQAFVGKLQAAVGALTGFISTVENAGSAAAGALGGGLQGMGMGAQFGPQGAVIGAIVGAAIGGIAGGKNAEIEKNINTATDQMREIMQNFALNSNNLALTIQQLGTIMAQLVQEKQSSKKGGGKYDQIIQQYQQQIQQLEVQQHQTIVAMNQQLVILNAPSGMQQYLQTLQGIVDQFNKYAGAVRDMSVAGTSYVEINGQMVAVSTDYANALQFLNQSLEQYLLTNEQQLTQDNTQAIQDALQLNDLLYQRIQMTQQYQDQVEQVLSAGVLSRQQTRAQTAGQKIEQITVDYTRQKEQLDEQISAAQYKVQAEGQIFNIASTRVALETQLLQLQNAQTNFDMERIGSLQDLVTQLQSAPISQIVMQLLQGTEGGQLQNIFNASPSYAPSTNTGGLGSALATGYGAGQSYGPPGSPNYNPTALPNFGGVVSNVTMSLQQLNSMRGVSWNGSTWVTSDGQWTWDSSQNQWITSPTGDTAPTQTPHAMTPHAVTSTSSASVPSTVSYLQQQASVDTQRLTTENQISTLATTRINLESQLLDKQNIVISADMMRITALQAMMNSNHPALVGNSLQNSGTASLPGTNTLDALIANAYADRGSLGFAQFRGTRL